MNIVSTQVPPCRGDRGRPRPRRLREHGYHYSQLTGKRYFRAPIDTYPLSIVRVDGSDPCVAPVLVDPGLRKIAVQGLPRRREPSGEQREISLDVKPCTRYYLVAVKPNGLASDFTVRVDYEEPVPGCTPLPWSASRMTTPLLEVRNLRVEFPDRAAARCSRWTTSRSTSRRARSSASSANPAPASR